MFGWTPPVECSAAAGNADPRGLLAVCRNAMYCLNFSVVLTLGANLLTCRLFVPSMRDCDCYQDRETNDEISKNLDGFHGAGADPGRDSPKSSAVSIGKHGHHHHSKRWLHAQLI